MLGKMLCFHPTVVWGWGEKRKEAMLKVAAQFSILGADFKKLGSVFVGRQMCKRYEFQPQLTAGVVIWRGRTEHLHPFKKKLGLQTGLAATMFEHGHGSYVPVSSLNWALSTHTTSQNKAGNIFSQLQIYFLTKLFLLCIYKMLLKFRPSLLGNSILSNRQISYKLEGRSLP